MREIRGSHNLKTYLTQSSRPDCVGVDRPYAVDPLEILFVREVMRSLAALPVDGSMEELRKMFRSGHGNRGQRLYPLIDSEKRVRGVMTRKRMAELLADSNHDGALLRDLANPDPVVAYADEPLRAVVYRMAETGFTRLPVVDSHASQKLAGIVSLDDLLRARTRDLEEERTRERDALRIRLPFRVKVGSES